MSRTCWRCRREYPEDVASWFPDPCFCPACRIEMQKPLVTEDTIRATREALAYQETIEARDARWLSMGWLDGMCKNWIGNGRLM